MDSSFLRAAEDREPSGSLGPTSPPRDSKARVPPPSLKALVLALALDTLWGEWPEATHPVVWIGRLLTWAEQHAPAHPAGRAAVGALVALGVPCISGALAGQMGSRFPWPLQAVLLKPTFAGRALLDAARRVEQALDANELDQARLDLRWLVSRPTSGLDAGLVAAAAVESLAENLVDSWVGPLCAYALFGLAGAYAYRAVNTADAMWGYRTSRYEWLGKSAARLDDLVAWVPARISVGLLWLVAAGAPREHARRVWWQDRRRTASPNAGQTMAMMAGVLDRRLEKPNHYVLNQAAPLPGGDDIARARQIVRRAMLGTVILVGALRLARHG